MIDRESDYSIANIYFSDGTAIKGYVKMFSSLDFIYGKLRYVLVVIPGDEEKKAYSRFIKTSFIDEIRYYIEELDEEGNPHDKNPPTAFHRDFQP